MLKNPAKTKQDIINWIRSYFYQNGRGSNAVIGISGGKDSTIAAALCVEALGAHRVIGVLMPDGEQADIQDGYRVVEALGIKSMLVNIHKSCQNLMDEIANNTLISDQTRINIPPRIRMATLYAVAQSLPEGGRVVNTCNKSEDFVGYSTKFGDSAGDFSPFQNLTVQEVKQIGYECYNIPEDLIDKTPSDGLCGKTDEDNLGFTYAQLEAFIEKGTCGDHNIDLKITTLHERNLHKLNPMPAYPLPESHVA